MVGTLSAIPATQLWTRLEKEGRLLGYSAGDQFGRPNFKTRMDGDVLYSGYLRILRTVYEPATYYARVLASLDRQKNARLPPLRRKKYPLHKIVTLLAMAVISIGIVAPYRLAFWRFLGTVMARYPSRLMQALINAVIGHHFIRYTSEVMVRERQLTPLIYHAETERVTVHASEGSPR